eukprot:CAMPEP_0174852132 /NCGR_PEP_ID=MMETSP1114-20130205/25204_1 /TAXON_ID=312471 /ORGANISM="Neobodo designis, Strain CCAP 1951/1" /LENGTH=386 /DNA_ID=CAMNT_0016086711 /DNA_START=80 /DNA_END=1240 /DNA_ORIENTATION=-
MGCASSSPSAGNGAACHNGDDVLSRCANYRDGEDETSPRSSCSGNSADSFNSNFDPGSQPLVVKPPLSTATADNRRGESLSPPPPAFPEFHDEGLGDDDGAAGDPDACHVDGLYSSFGSKLRPPQSLRDLQRGLMGRSSTTGSASTGFLPQRSAPSLRHHQLPAPAVGGGFAAVPMDAAASVSSASAASPPEVPHYRRPPPAAAAAAPSAQEAGVRRASSPQEASRPEFSRPRASTTTVPDRSKNTPPLKPSPRPTSGSEADPAHRAEHLSAITTKQGDHGRSDLPQRVSAAASPPRPLLSFPTDALTSAKLLHHLARQREHRARQRAVQSGSGMPCDDVDTFGDLSSDCTDDPGLESGCTPETSLSLAAASSLNRVRGAPQTSQT